MIDIEKESTVATKRKRDGLKEKDSGKKEKDRADIKRNQEWCNLTSSEKRGLKKLRNRVKKGEIIIVKTDKSGKLMAMKKEDYLKFGIKGVGSDRKVDRNEAKKIERKINDHTRFWIKMTNLGENHGHYQRMNESKINNSESLAPRYYMYKDHKCGGGWRPVVSGCSSGTLGLSNLISEIVESLCISVRKPYELISSTDMLSRFEDFNEWVKKEKIERGEN